MRILLVNDDGYDWQGIKTLAKIMRKYGSVSVIAPKLHQSGMSMAVDLSPRPVACRDMGVDSDGVHWQYVDATPAGCVKYALNYLELDVDVLVSGINHGANYAAAVLYSGTMGAAAEGSLNGVPSIGVSLDSFGRECDFGIVEEYFPAIFEKLISTMRVDRSVSASSQTHGIYYNVNFPAIPASECKGVRVGVQGKGRWIKEYKPWPEDEPISLEPGETAVRISGDYENDTTNPPCADHYLVKQGYISIVAHQLDTTDYAEKARLEAIFGV